MNNVAKRMETAGTAQFAVPHPVILTPVYGSVWTPLATQVILVQFQSLDPSQQRYMVRHKVSFDLFRAHSVADR